MSNSVNSDRQISRCKSFSGKIMECSQTLPNFRKFKRNENIFNFLLLVGLDSQPVFSKSTVETLWTNSTDCSGVSVLKFEQVNGG